VPELPKKVAAVCKELKKHGFSAYLVGGCVRDILLNIEPHDYDITTDALPEEMLGLFGDAARPTGLAHGTVTAWGIEITTYRTDGVYLDGRHPQQVTFTRDLASDLQRRDFTVNAMAMTVTGELTDLYGGQEDLHRGVIRCVGDPDTRFGEDALRILRGLRFASVLGFAIEEKTAASIHRNRESLQKIAPERIRVEMDKLLCGEGVAQILLAYPDVLGVFLPEIQPAVGLDQRNPHHCYTVWEHIARSVAAVPADRTLRWTMLLHDLGKPRCATVDKAGIGHFYGHGKISTDIARECTRRLRFDSRTAQRIATLVDWHDRVIPRTEKSIRRALSRLGEEALRQLIEVKRADNLAQHPDFHGVQGELDRAQEIMEQLLREEDCFTLSRLAVNGRDLEDIGLHGVAVGQMLRALLQQVIEEKLPNERDALLQWAAGQQ
jgi:tRNA nucleotidyltransferase (CCA-adding enzyme)